MTTNPPAPTLLLFLCLATAGLAPALAEQAADPDPSAKTLVWPDGTRYVGGVTDGKRTGKGTIFWPDGTRFVGQFDNDMRNGPGTMVLPDGTVYTGYFRDDKLVDSPVLENTGTEAIVPVAGDDTPAEYNVATAQAETPFAQPLTEITPDSRKAISDTLDLWRKAWSEQNVPQYLAYYSADFAVPGNQSRSQWQALRRTRLKRPGFIEVGVSIEAMEVVEDNVVDVTFVQTYRSDRFSDETRKKMRLRREDVDWKILRETSL